MAFCNVATNLLAETPSTCTEQGTLTCPFPEPVLNIARAVLLTWPKAEEGFTVECAPTPEGPWAAVDATKVVQDGNHSVTVKIDVERKYFRLVKP